MTPVESTVSPSRVPFRLAAVVVAVGWVLAAACWLAALFVPWTGHGLLSSASLMDAVRLVGRGVVASVVPASAAWLLVVPAVCAIVLLALAGFRGRWVLLGQCCVATLGAFAALGIGWKLTEGELGRAGTGVWLSLLGVAFAIATAILAVLDARIARRNS